MKFRNEIMGSKSENMTRKKLIMKINTKKWCISILLLIGVVGIILISGCVHPGPSDVSQGYYEYPETWGRHKSDEVTSEQGFKTVVMFTKPSEGTSITYIAKTSVWKDTNEAKSVWKEAFNGSITNETDLNVNNLKGYEITRNESGTKSKMVIFIVDGMAYEFDYGFADNETSFNTSEAIFDNVVNSFKVK